MVSDQSKQVNKHTHARVQWSHSSVGLARASPNYAGSTYLWYV